MNECLFLRDDTRRERKERKGSETVFAVGGKNWGKASEFRFGKKRLQKYEGALKVQKFSVVIRHIFVRGKKRMSVFCGSLMVNHFEEINF